MELTFVIFVHVKPLNLQLAKMTILVSYLIIGEEGGGCNSTFGVRHISTRKNGSLINLGFRKATLPSTCSTYLSTGK